MPMHLLPSLRRASAPWRRACLLVLLLACAWPAAWAQGVPIAVSDFYLATHDMTARNTETQVIEPLNGERCALIKVQTKERGFTFDFGASVSPPVRVIEQKNPGETWIYAPPGVKYINIYHPRFANLRDHFMGAGLESGCTYIMALTSGTVETVVREAITSQYLVFRVTPAAAMLEVEGEPWQLDAEGSAMRYLPFGRYQWRASAADYHTDAGLVDVNSAEQKHVVEVRLRPAYGWLEVGGAGALAGASVFVDGKLVGTAPVKTGQMASGEHRVRIVKAMYRPYEATVAVEDERTLTLAPALAADFATVTLSVPDAETEIWVNDERRGTGTWTGPLASGDYRLEARRAHHRTTAVTQRVEAEPSAQRYELAAPAPIYGQLNVAVTPIDAEILLDGRPVGQTPQMLPEVLEGEHTVTVRKAGYGDMERRVTVADGQTAMVEGTLPTATQVTLSVNAPQAELTIDGRPAGRAAGTHTMAYGTRRLRLTAEGYEPLETTVEVSEAQRTFALQLPRKGKRTYTVNGVSFTMVPVEGGTFTMGATSELLAPFEKPAHPVTLSTFAIGETEVTQALWQAVMGSNPSSFKGDNLPVENVSWNDCQEFIQTLNALTGERFRLPTEAEWEYAARGGNRGKGYQYSGSKKLGDVAWYWDNADKKTHPVGTKRANELGLYDMSGNVYEWCQDWAGPYSSSAQTDPTGPVSGSGRVFRGGGWFGSAWFCRVAFRDGLDASLGGGYLGFRLAR